jgi:hypothetical protein
MVRVYADECGETHLHEIDVLNPARLLPAGVMARMLDDVPVTTMHFIRILDWLPKQDLHPGPRRQIVVYLQGEARITTTDGDSRRFRPGDCLIVDDVIGKGHVHEDLGDERLLTLGVGIADTWVWPNSYSSAG